MKRKIIVNMLLATMAAGGTVVWAGSSKPVSDKPCHCAEQETRVPPPPPPEVLVDHMTRQLNLTGEQQSKIKALFTKDMENTGPLSQKLAEYRKQLQAAMKSTTFDEAAIRAIAVKQAQAEVDLTVLKAGLRSRINAVLTPGQRTLAEKCPPPFHHDHEQRLAFGYGRKPHPFYGNEDGPDPLFPPQPPPCRGFDNHHSDADFEDE